MGANDKKGGRGNQSKREDKQKQGSNERRRKRRKREDEQNHGANDERQHGANNEREGETTKKSKQETKRTKRANEWMSNIMERTRGADNKKSKTGTKARSEGVTSGERTSEGEVDRRRENESTRGAKERKKCEHNEVTK
jgi:hypothetical protein